MRHTPHGNIAYTTTSLPLFPRSINSDRSHKDPKEEAYSANQSDEYSTENNSAEGRLWDSSSPPSNHQGNTQGGRCDNQVQGGNSSEINQSECLTSSYNPNPTRAP